MASKKEAVVQRNLKVLFYSTLGGMLITAALWFCLALFNESDHPLLHDIFSFTLLWPVAVCLHLSGPGPRIGPPAMNWHEGTPVQLVAAMIGLGLTWAFYAGVIALAVWLRRRRRAAIVTSITH